MFEPCATDILKLLSRGAKTFKELDNLLRQWPEHTLEQTLAALIKTEKISCTGKRFWLRETVKTDLRKTSGIGDNHRLKEIAK